MVRWIFLLWKRDQTHIDWKECRQRCRIWIVWIQCWAAFTCFLLIVAVVFWRGYVVAMVTNVAWKPMKKYTLIAFWRVRQVWRKSKLFCVSVLVSKSTQQPKQLLRASSRRKCYNVVSKKWVNLMRLKPMKSLLFSLPLFYPSIF